MPQKRDEFFSDVDFTKLFNTISDQPIAIFAGSGISVDTPSNLPTGEGLKQAIFDMIFFGVDFPDPIKNAIKKVLAGFRPETFLFLISDWGGYDWKGMVEVLLDSLPNCNHNNISSLVKNNKIQFIITTNFDCLLEQSLNMRNIPFNLFVSNNDFQKFNPHEYRGLFKLHGSISDGSGTKNSASIIGSMTEVAGHHVPSLSSLKSNVLRSILENYIVIFIGYSGHDEYDIQPIVNDSHCKKIIWISHKKMSDPPIIKWSANIKKRAPEDIIDILISKQTDSVRVYCHTSSFLCYMTKLFNGDFFEPGNTILKRDYVKKYEVKTPKSPYGFLGQLLLFGGEYSNARWAYDMALETGKITDSYFLGDIYRGKGICCKYLHEFEAAIESLKKAKDLYETEYSKLLKENESSPFIHQRHFLMMSQISEDIGLDYYETGDFNNALEYLMESLKWSERIILPIQYRYLGRNFSNLGNITYDIYIKSTENGYEDKDLLEQSFAYFEKSVDFQEKAGDMIGLAKSLNSWALKTTDTFNWKEVFKRSFRSYTLMTELGNPFSNREYFQAVSLIIISLCGLAENKNEAKKLLEETQPNKFAPIQDLIAIYEIAFKENLIFKSKPMEEHLEWVKKIQPLVASNYGRLKRGMS